MTIDPAQSAGVYVDEEPSLPAVPGGWQTRLVELGWTSIRIAAPLTPDALLDLPEVQEANRRDDSMPYWAKLWSAAEKMAAALPRANWPAGAEVLEVGCGLGLVGIAGLRCGWRVHLTDGEPAALAAARHNALLNGFADAAVSYLDWRDPPRWRIPVILACDVLYEGRHHPPILNLIDRVLTTDGCCWIGDPGRTPLVEFYQSALQRGLRVILRDADGEVCRDPVRGQFQILELTKSGDSSQIACGD